MKFQDDVVDELKNNAHQNKYLPMQGLNELRNAISKYNKSKNNHNYKEENVYYWTRNKRINVFITAFFLMETYYFQHLVGYLMLHKL